MNLYRYRRAIWLCVALIPGVLLGLSCSSLPTFVHDLARQAARPVPLDGSHGPLSAAQSRAVLQRLQRGGQAGRQPTSSAATWHWKRPLSAAP